MQHVPAVELAPDMDGRALTGVLIDDHKHAECFVVMGAIRHEVISPDMVLRRRAKTDA